MNRSADPLRLHSKPVHVSALGYCVLRADGSMQLTSGTPRSRFREGTWRGKSALNMSALAAAGWCLPWKAARCSHALTRTFSTWPAWSVLPSVCIFGGLRKVD